MADGDGRSSVPDLSEGLHPWTIDEDNSDRVVVIDSRGDTVFLVEFSEIPEDIRDQLKGQAGVNAFFMVAASAAYMKYPNFFTLAF